MRLSPRTKRAAVTGRGCPCSEIWKSAAVSVGTTRPFASVTMTSMTGSLPPDAAASACGRATDAASATVTASQRRTSAEHAEPDEFLGTPGSDLDQVLTRRQRAEREIEVPRRAGAAAGR